MPTTTAPGDGDTTAQGGAEGEGTTPTATAGSAASAGAATLESRYAGLEARLTERGRAQAEAEKDRDAAIAKLAAYEAGKLGESEASQAALKALEERTAKAERAAQVARIEARYPETFGTLGEASANLTEEQLAATEARFKGVAVEDLEPPTPRSPATGRPAPTIPGDPSDGSGKKKPLTQLRAEFVNSPLPWQND